MDRHHYVCLNECVLMKEAEDCSEGVDDDREEEETAVEVEFSLDFLHPLALPLVVAEIWKYFLDVLPASRF